jgi:hypothetical protein
MDSELASMLERADELLKDLGDEYQRCLKSQTVTERAQNLTHEVVEKLRHALDHTMTRAWDKYVSPKLSEKDRSRIRKHVYFPITSNLDSFRSRLGQGRMTDLDMVNKNLYDFLLNKQPFSSEDNKWLYFLTKIAAEGKHVTLVPQKRIETRRIKVSTPNGSSVSWDPSMVKFGNSVSVLNAPVNPNTQRIVPTPGVTEQLEIWVSFICEGYGVNALGFCKEASQKTRVLMEEMVAI